MYRKLLENKRIVWLHRSTKKLMVKVKKLILSTVLQIPSLVLVDTMLFLPLNVGRLNSWIFLEIDLLAQFEASTLRELQNNGEELNLSKNQTSSVTAAPVVPTVEVEPAKLPVPVAPVAAPAAVEICNTSWRSFCPAQAAGRWSGLKVHLLVWLTSVPPPGKT